MEVSGFRVQGAGFRVQGSGFRVQGSGFRVQGSGFRVQGSGFRVSTALSRRSESDTVAARNIVPACASTPASPNRAT